MTGPRPPAGGPGPCCLPQPVGGSPRDGEGEETAGSQCGFLGSPTRPTGGDEATNALTALGLLEALR